ncbi:MAG: hypothetical protein KIG61_03865 [Muribaculaceae bacterium]|nr:hypothetical protein [Muribaculaceae bacterium]
MGFKRFLRKTLLGTRIVEGHILDALEKKKRTGKSFNECLRESVKETIAEDMPGTSHIYNAGKKDGRVQGTVEQAERDKKKMGELQQNHERDREKWEQTDKERKKLIDDLTQDKD